MNTTTVLQNLATWVLWNSSGAALLVVMILAMRLIAGKAMSARLRSRLWLLVVVRLMLPMLPAVSLPSRVVARASSLMQRSYAKPIAHEAIPPQSQSVERAPIRSRQIGIDNEPQFVVVEEGMITPMAAPTPMVISASVPIVTAEPPPAPKFASINWLRVLLITWLAGTVPLLARLIGTTIRLSRMTRRLDLITDPKIVELLGSCCELFNVKQIPQLLAGGEGSAPALIGVIRPKILLPATLAFQLALEEIRLIFLHELAHLRRRDVLLNYLFAVLTALHWFNPLLRIASWRMAADRELACDEAVLQVTSRRHARLYGCTILKLIELLDFQRLPAGAVGVVQNKTLIQRRIDMIASYPSRTPRNSWLVRCAAVSLTLVAAVSAIRAQEAPAPIPAPPAAPSALPTPAPAAVPAAPAAEAPALPPVPVPASAGIGIAPPAAATPPGALPTTADPALPARPSTGTPVPPSADDVSALPRGPYLVDPLAPGLVQPNAILPAGTAAGSSLPGGVRMGGGRQMMSGFGVSRSNGATSSVEDAAAREANAEVMQKLTKGHSADYHGTGLRDVLSSIADASGVDVVIDERAASEAGVDLTAASVTLHTRVRPMEQILSLTLRLASPQLDYSIYNGVVFVSSREALNRRIVTRIYDLPSSVDREAMLQMIGAAVGNAKCNFFDQKIVVTAPEVSQRDVARLLAQIGPVQAPAGAKAMLMFHLHYAKAADVAAQFPKELGSAVADDTANSVLITTQQLDAAKEFVAKLDGVPKSNPADHIQSRAALQSGSADSNNVQALVDALAMYKTMYGPDSAKVKQLEQQVAAIRLRDASNATEESPARR